jgi:cytochrome c biogenesis protein CcmG/thiol:disulfide interchange protein DsbE
MIARVLPLLVFLLLVGVMALGLRLDSSLVPSPLIDQTAPQFSLPRLDAPGVSLGTDDFKGSVWLLNVWASWCVSCLDEHPLLVELLQGKVMLVGLNYKDVATDADAWLQKHGDPYYASLLDIDGKVGLNWGVYGVPETFVIDKQGTIRYKHVGPLTRADIDTVVLPQVLELQAL